MHQPLPLDVRIDMRRAQRSCEIRQDAAPRSHAAARGHELAEVGLEIVTKTFAKLRWVDAQQPAVDAPRPLARRHAYTDRSFEPSRQRAPAARVVRGWVKRRQTAR